MDKFSPLSFSFSVSSKWLIIWIQLLSREEMLAYSSRMIDSFLSFVDVSSPIQSSLSLLSFPSLDHQFEWTHYSWNVFDSYSWSPFVLPLDYGQLAEICTSNSRSFGFLKVPQRQPKVKLHFSAHSLSASQVQSQPCSLSLFEMS